jgi:hypothetical protein
VSAKLGLALLVGGAGAAALADKLPPSKRALALYGGLGAAVGGVFLLLKAARDAGGVFAGLGSIIANNDKPTLESAEDLAPARPLPFTGGGNVPATPDQAIAAGTPGQFVIPYFVELLAPTDGTTINPSLWSSSYKAQLRITNATADTITDVVSYEIVEEYALGGDERVEGVSERVSVLPKQSKLVTLNIKVGGGAVRYSSASASAKFKFRAFVVSSNYIIKP